MRKKLGRKRFAAAALTVCMMSQTVALPVWADEKGFVVNSGLDTRGGVFEGRTEPCSP